MTRGRILRCVGQALFLALTLIFLGLVAATLHHSRKRGVTHLTPLYLLLATAPFFIVRGLFGILSSALISLSFYDPQNYSENGLSTRILIVEYVLGTTMEFIVRPFRSWTRIGADGRRRRSPVSSSRPP